MLSYLHLLEDSGAIVGDNDISIRATDKKQDYQCFIQKRGDSYLTSILSMPFGPREVFMRLATVRAAMMLI